jgi:hypothetical protein
MQARQIIERILNQHAGFVKFGFVFYTGLTIIYSLLTVV